MFDLPGLENVDEVVINREVAESQGGPGVRLWQGASGGAVRLIRGRRNRGSCRQVHRRVRLSWPSKLTISDMQVAAFAVH